MSDEEPDWTLASAGMLLILLLYVAAAYAVESIHLALAM